MIYQLILGNPEPNLKLCPIREGIGPDFSLSRSLNHCPCGIASANGHWESHGITHSTYSTTQTARPDRPLERVNSHYGSDLHQDTLSRADYKMRKDYVCWST